MSFPRVVARRRVERLAKLSESVKYGCLKCKTHNVDDICIAVAKELIKLDFAPDNNEWKIIKTQIADHLGQG